MILLQLGPAEVRRELRLSATWRLRERTGDRSPVTEQARQRERRFDGARDLVEHELESHATGFGGAGAGTS